MATFHSATFRLLGTEPRISAMALSEVETVERRIGGRLPASVREWYCYHGAIDILEKHSNQDPPIALDEFAVLEWKSHRLLPFRVENQGVCIWSILLDGLDDPPVYVDVDSEGTRWQMLAPTFSIYVYSCVWDYEMVFNQVALVQAQNVPLSQAAIDHLETELTAQPKTFGWPGSTQHRFKGKDHNILIWSAEDQADWFLGAGDARSLETGLKLVWNLDGVGTSFYDCSDLAKRVLEKIALEK
jgi:hypothetical protein